MVTALYAVILIPIVTYVLFTLVEIWLVTQIASKNHSRSHLFIQMSTEVTHTLLVFAYAQFMVTFSGLLVQIGDDLYLPAAILMATLIIRGSLYLILFYRDSQSRPAYALLLATYLIGVISVLWGLVIVVSGITSTGFVPDTTDVPLVLGFGVPALLVFLVPLIHVYAKAIRTIAKKK